MATAIEETDRYATDMAESIQEYSQTEMVSSYIGRTPPRYYLSNVSFGPQPNYAQLLVKCKTSGEARELHALLQDSIRLKYPEPLIKVNKFELSPLTEALIEARAGPGGIGLFGWSRYRHYAKEPESSRCPE